jgi:hypothetical protein
MQSPGDVEKANVDASITYTHAALPEASPRHTEPATRLPIQFRTLSIHVETRASETGGQEEQKRRQAVKGYSH